MIIHNTVARLVAAATNNEINLTPDDLHLSDAPESVGSSQIEGILMTVYFWAGIVAVLAIIIGGIRYVTSNGDASGVKSAKDTVLYAVIGLIVVIMAAAITSFIIGNVA